MFGAIYIGLSGLSAYSRGLQQVSSNVSNLNSSGFKASSVSFTDLFGDHGGSGLSLTNGGGGSGAGVNLNDVKLDFRQGELRQSQNDLDLAVDGKGFLVLLKGDEVLYTRTGSFEVDKDGYVVLSGTEYRLATLDSAGRAVSLSIDAARTDAPVKTSKVSFADNLSSTAASYGISDIKVYDATGAEHVWTAAFTRNEAAVGNEWTIKVTDEKAREIGTQTLRFDIGAVAADTAKLTFADADNGLSVEFDFSQNVTSFSAGTISTLRAAAVDGHGSGNIATLRVNENGHLEIGYSNEEKMELGAVALADFRDVTGLEQRGGGLFAHNGIGQRELLSSEDSRVGQVVSRRLEASNVDLSEQFGDLILIQRGFQASSQIISVSNDMIQQLFGIRGQG